MSSTEPSFMKIKNFYNESDLKILKATIVLLNKFNDLNKHFVELMKSVFPSQNCEIDYVSLLAKIYLTNNFILVLLFTRSRKFFFLCSNFVRMSNVRC